MTSNHETIGSGSNLGHRGALPWFDRHDVAKLISQSEVSRAHIAGMDVEAALLYWDELRGEDIAPTRKAFKIDGLPTKLIPSVAIVDFIGDPVDFYYRFFGSNMVQVSGMELTGKYYYADKIEGYGFINAALLPKLIERIEPIYHVSRWQSVKGFIYETTTARLPLADDEMNIIGAVTANSWSRV